MSTTCNSWSRTVVEAYNKSQTLNGKKRPKFPVSVKCGSRVKKFIAKNWFTPLRLNWVLFKLTSGIVVELYDAFYIFNQSQKIKLLHKYNFFSIFLLFFYKLFIRNTYRFALWIKMLLQQFNSWLKNWIHVTNISYCKRHLGYRYLRKNN